MKKIAVINDLSGFGKCSLGVALPIISACGIQCCPLTTGVFSNQTGYDTYKSVDFTDYLPSFIDEWKKLSPSFDAILTGFIPNSSQGKIISSFIESFKHQDTIVVVDPVMGDDGLVYPCYDEESIKSVKQLAESADVITPNLTELSLLCNKEYSTLESLSQEELLDEVLNMSKLLSKTVITTGIRLGDSVANAVYYNGKFDIVKSKNLGGSFSGTGDILASIVTARLVAGCDALTAVKDASAFIEKAIQKTIDDTNGKLNPADGIHFELFLKEL